MKFSDFVIVGSNSLQLITFYHLPMQKREKMEPRIS